MQLELSFRRSNFCLSVCAIVFSASFVDAQTSVPSLDEALNARRDVWGEAAMVQPNGPSYEFFEKLLPPPRYVNADFRAYPIVLSAPNTKVKARLISNGSGLNLRGGAGAWNENGTPMIYRVGPDQLAFGNFAQRIPQEPQLAEGYLPIVELRYLHQTPIGNEGMVALTQTRVERDSEIYRLEAFASMEPALAEHGVVFVKFALAQGTTGIVTVQPDSRSPLKFTDGKLTDEKGRLVAWFDKNWKWERQRAQAKFDLKGSVTLAIATTPLESGSAELDYDAQRKTCAEGWKQILQGGMSVETPEPVVNNAWRHLLLQNFELINGDRMHYSQGNQYDKLYE